MAQPANHRFVTEASVILAAKANAADLTAEAATARAAEQTNATATAGKLSTTDASVTNARTPTSHATSHASGGSDALAPAAIGADVAGAAAGVQTNLTAEAATARAAEAGKVAKSDLIFNVNDYTSLSAALAAIPAGATLRLPTGTYTAVNINTLGKSVTVVGDGSRSTIIDVGTGAYGFSYPAAGSGSRVTFRDIGFTGSTGSIFTLYRDYTISTRFIDCRFSGFANTAIYLAGVNLACVRCDFSTAGTPGTSNAIQHAEGSQSILLQDCTFRYLYRGFYCTDTNGAAQNVVMTGNLFDGGWMYLKSTGGSSGAAVTYAASTLTDTAAAFPALTPYSTVRVMAVKQTGALSNSRVQGQITDTAANYLTAGVSPGDIVRTTGQWGVVDEVLSATVLKIEEWLDLTTYDPAISPALSTPYTIYGLVIGRVQSNTATSIVVDLWRNWSGTPVTPAAGTQYELAPNADYQGVYIYRAEKVRITNNTFRRSWADQISAQVVRHAIIANNNVYDGQDVGITVGQPSGITDAVVTGNRISHQGTAGIYLGNVQDSPITSNKINGAAWMLGVPGAYCAIIVEGCSRLNIANNTMLHGAVNDNRAIHLNGTPGAIADITLNNNRTGGYTNDISITGANVTGTTGQFQKGTSIELLSAAVGPAGDFTGSGAPAVNASPGSTYRNMSGGAAASFYVKESGTAATGWVAK